MKLAKALAIASIWLSAAGAAVAAVVHLGIEGVIVAVIGFFCAFMATVMVV